MSDHTRYQDDIGAYLLGALDDRERREFERHLAGCGECQEEVERLRPAADALPGSVVQLEPPTGLKGRLMAEVERDSNVVALPQRRRPMRLIAVAAVLLLGLVVGFGIAQLHGDETRRTRLPGLGSARRPAGSGTDLRGRPERSRPRRASGRGWREGRVRDARGARRRAGAERGSDRQRAALGNGQMR